VHDFTSSLHDTLRMRPTSIVHPIKALLSITCPPTTSWRSSSAVKFPRRRQSDLVPGSVRMAEPSTNGFHCEVTERPASTAAGEEQTSRGQQVVCTSPFPSRSETMLPISRALNMICSQEPAAAMRPVRADHGPRGEMLAQVPQLLDVRRSQGSGTGCAE
jgi:hypothetical protein